MQSKLEVEAQEAIIQEGITSKVNFENIWTHCVFTMRYDSDVCGNS